MDEQRAVGGFPDDWRGRIPGLVGRCSLDVAGLATTVQITYELLEHVLLPVLSTLDAQSQARRLLAGLAGVPGSGKSTFAALLKHVADTLLGKGQLTIIGLDGWHFPNVVLDRRTCADAAGRMVPLRQRKGGPESFNVPELLRALDDLARGDMPVLVPVYDRRLHDPVANGLEIAASVRIVVLEGNYILCETPPWNAFIPRLHPRLFLPFDEQTAGDRVIARHIRGGCTPQEAHARYERNDRLNIQLAATGSEAADVLINLDPPRLTWVR